MKRPAKSKSTGRPRQKRRVINKKRVILSIFLLAIGAELVFALLTSPMFAVKNIKVVHNQTVSDRQVLQALRLPQDANIFRINKDSVLREVRRNPVVKEASLRRRIPTTLIVLINERRPLFILSTSGALYQVDSYGVPFRQDKTLNGKLPVIFCEIRKRIILGRPIRDPAFDSAKECLLLAQAKKVFRGIRITVDQKSDLCLNVRDDFQVKLGRPEQLARKLDYAEQVIQQSPEFQKRGEYIDVTCLEAPAYKLKE